MSAAEQKSKPRRWRIVLLLLAAAAGLGYGLYLSTEQVTVHEPIHTGEHRLAGADLKYYRIVIDRVHNGENYYDVAREELPHWGFPIGSPFNWRLPTYAYLLGGLGDPTWIQGVLVLIAAAGMVLTFVAQLRALGMVSAGSTVLLLLGVAGWPLAGDAYFAQEVWAGMLILVSIGASGCALYSPHWRILAVASGLLALFFRELALPYCFFAGLLAWWHGRRREALAWLGGMVLFGLYLVWHVGQVLSQLQPEDRADSFGITSWIQFGGLAFDIMATRMNAFVMLLPGWAVFLYLTVAVIGLAGWREELGMLLLASTVTYLLAFAIIGRSMNFNWGLMFAPMLPFGVVRAPAAMRDLVNRFRKEQTTGDIAEPVSGKLE